MRFFSGHVQNVQELCGLAGFAEHKMLDWPVLCFFVPDCLRRSPDEYRYALESAGRKDQCSGKTGAAPGGLSFRESQPADVQKFEGT
jgi:hypothetical protein